MEELASKGANLTLIPNLRESFFSRHPLMTKIEKAL